MKTIIICQEKDNTLDIGKLSSRLSEGTKIVVEDADYASRTFDRQIRIPDVYVVGQQWDGIAEDPSILIKNITWVKRNHPEVKVVAWYYRLAKNKIMKAGADAFVEYDEGTGQELVDCLAGYVGYKNGRQK